MSNIVKYRLPTDFEVEENTNEERKQEERKLINKIRSNIRNNWENLHTWFVAAQLDEFTQIVAKNSDNAVAVGLRFSEMPLRLEFKLFHHENLREFDCDGVVLGLRKSLLRIWWRSTDEVTTAKILINNVVFKTKDKEDSLNWQIGAPVWEKQEGAFTAATIFI